MAWREDLHGLGNARDVARVDERSPADLSPREAIEASDTVSLAALNDLLLEAGDFHGSDHKAMVAASARLQDTAADLARMMATLEAQTAGL